MLVSISSRSCSGPFVTTIIGLSMGRYQRTFTKVWMLSVLWERTKAVRERKYVMSRSLSPSKIWENLVVSICIGCYLSGVWGLQYVVACKKLFLRQELPNPFEACIHICLPKGSFRMVLTYSAYHSASRG